MDDAICRDLVRLLVAGERPSLGALGRLKLEQVRPYVCSKMRASGVKGFSLTIPIFEVSREVRLWLKGRAPRPDAKRPWVEPILESLESTGHAYLGWLGRLELMGHTSRWLRFRPTPEFGEAVRAAAASSAP